MSSTPFSPRKTISFQFRSLSKRIVLGFAMLLSFLILAPVLAQDCEPYIPMEEGTLFIQSNYSHKGKLESKSEQTIVKKEQNGTTLTASVAVRILDNKDVGVSSSNYDITCENGVFKVDLAAMIPSDQWDKYQNMTVKLDGDFLELPSNPSAGDKLPDGKLTVSVTSSEIPVATIVVFVTNRTVVKIESITTPAGTFECVLFSYDVVTEVGALPIRVKASSKDWYAKNAGLVRQESYSKNGKLTGYSELTKLVIP